MFSTPPIGICSSHVPGMMLHSHSPACVKNLPIACQTAFQRGLGGAAGQQGPAQAGNGRNRQTGTVCIWPVNVPSSLLMHQQLPAGGCMNCSSRSSSNSSWSAHPNTLSLRLCQPAMVSHTTACVFCSWLSLLPCCASALSSLAAALHPRHVLPCPLHPSPAALVRVAPA